MKLTDCINFQLTRVQKCVFTYFKESLAKFDVTPSQYALLSLLWDGEELSPSQMAASLDLDNSSITGLLNRMVLAGISAEDDAVLRRSLAVLFENASKLA